MTRSRAPWLALLCVAGALVPALPQAAAAPPRATVSASAVSTRGGTSTTPAAQVSGTTAAAYVNTSTTAAASLSDAERSWLNSGWTQIWRDDFSGTTLSDRWQHCYPWLTCTNQTNGEYQWYQPGNVTVSKGVLRLTARRQSVTREVVPGTVRTFPYTSGMIQTSRSFASREGRIVIRAKSVAGQAIWPALWLLPTDQSWPPEIDFFEQYGNARHFEQTVHTGPGTKAQFNQDGIDTTSGFHTYAVQWNKDVVVMMMDGRVTGVTHAVRPDKPLYLLMNLAVGGTWVGAPTSATPQTASFQIDSVVAYGPAGSNVLAG